MATKNLDTSDIFGQIIWFDVNMRNKSKIYRFTKR